MKFCYRNFYSFIYGAGVKGWTHNLIKCFTRKVIWISRIPKGDFMYLKMPWRINLSRSMRINLPNTGQNPKNMDGHLRNFFHAPLQWVCIGYFC